MSPRPSVMPSATVVPSTISWYAVPGSVVALHRLRESRSVPGLTVKPFAAGGVASISRVSGAGSLTLPAASVATTRNVCGPVLDCHDSVCVEPTAEALATTSAPSRTTSAEPPSARTATLTAPPAAMLASPKVGRCGGVRSCTGLGAGFSAGLGAALVGAPLPGAGWSAACAGEPAPIARSVRPARATAPV